MLEIHANSEFHTFAETQSAREQQALELKCARAKTVVQEMRDQR